MSYVLPHVKTLGAEVDVLQSEVLSVLRLHYPVPVEVIVLGPADSAELTLPDLLDRQMGRLLCPSLTTKAAKVRTLTVILLLVIFQLNFDLCLWNFFLP